MLCAGLMFLRCTCAVKTADRPEAASFYLAELKVGKDDLEGEGRGAAPLMCGVGS